MLLSAVVLSTSLVSCSAPTVKGSGIVSDESRDISYVSWVEIKVKGAGAIDYWEDPEEIPINASRDGSVNKK